MGICLFCAIYKRDLNWVICPFYHVRVAYVHPLSDESPVSGKYTSILMESFLGRPVGGCGSPSLLEDCPDILVGAQGRGSLYFQVFRYWLSSLDEVQMSPTRQWELHRWIRILKDDW